MTRNGVDFGIRLSGTGDTWFTAPAPQVNALYFPGYGPNDANPDMGDSSITETMGTYPTLAELLVQLQISFPK